MKLLQSVVVLFFFLIIPFSINSQCDASVCCDASCNDKAYCVGMTKCTGSTADKWVICDGEKTPCNLNKPRPKGKDQPAVTVISAG